MPTAHRPEPVHRIDWERATELMALHEGRRKYLYKDTKGLWTIGIGHNIQERGLSDAMIDFVFQEDFKEAIEEADKFPWFRDLDGARQYVIVDMIFNMGLPRFSLFRKTIAYLEGRDYRMAAIEMLDSKWAREDVGETRSQRLSQMMHHGRWPDEW